MPNTSLFRIADERLWYQIRDSFGEGGGTYAVVAKQGEQVVSIPRLLGEDQQGRLYIGKAESFLDRVINLKKSTDPGYRSSSHDFGNRYKEHSAIQLQFPYDHLYLVLTGDSNPALLEKVQMQAYLDTFGELPPLNRNL